MSVDCQIDQGEVANHLYVDTKLMFALGLSEGSRRHEVDPCRVSATTP